MSDRFDFLEFGDARPTTLPIPEETQPEAETGLGWKPLRLSNQIEIIGEPGTGPGQFSAPTGLAVDPWGALYVADSNNHRIQRITLGGDCYLFGRPGNGPGQFWGPQAIAVDPTGQYFFVAEQGNNRVQCFRFNSNQQQFALGPFQAPSGLAFDAEGMLWVADTGNAQLWRFDIRTGKAIGGMDRSVGIACPISLAGDRAHNIYVTDAATDDVTRYTYSGERGPALGQNRRLAAPRQVAVDDQGRIYLAESGADRLIIFDAQGNSLLTVSTPGARLGPLRAPAGVALGPNGEIYVADTLNHRVLRFLWE